MTTNGVLLYLWKNRHLQYLIIEFTKHLPINYSIKFSDISILWNSIALTSIVVTELANTMKYGEGVLYNFVFTELPFI